MDGAFRHEGLRGLPKKDLFHFDNSDRVCEFRFGLAGTMTVQWWCDLFSEASRDASTVPWCDTWHDCLSCHQNTLLEQRVRFPQARRLLTHSCLLCYVGQGLHFANAKVKPSLPRELSQQWMLGHVQPHSACRNSHAAR